MARSEIEPQPGARALGMLLAALATLIAVLSSAPGYGAALGGGRALHGALALSCAEPPGHPLALLWWRAAALVPLGPLALRAALAAGVLQALAAAALYRAIDTGLRRATGLRPLVASPLALGLTLLAAGAAPLWAGGAPAHAAVALAVSCLCLERWVAFASGWPRLRLDALRAAALLLGLLLAEQPALAAVLLLAALPLLRQVLREYRLPAWNLAPLALGLPLWLYGALARADALGLPEARSPLALVRAAFALGTDPPSGWGPYAGALDSAVLAALAALGAAGAALALRVPARRKLGACWLVTAAGAFAAGHWLADGASARALAVCAAAALASFAIAPLLAGDGKSRLAPVLAIASVALGLGQLQAVARAANAFDRAAGDALGDALRRDLPARSALLLAPDLAAGFLDAEGEERVRPDLLVALAPWQLDLRAAERVAARSPELLPLLRAQLLVRAPGAAVGPDADPQERSAAELPSVELAALAARRPALIELEPPLDDALHAVLVPYGLYHQVSTHSLSPADVDLAAADAERRLTRLYAELDLTRLDPDARALLADRHRAEAAYARSIGDAQLAGRAAQRLRALHAPAQR